MSFPYVATLTTEAVQKQYASRPGVGLGTLGMTPDGSMYRLCKAGGAIVRTQLGLVNGNKHLAGLTGQSAEAALTKAIVAGDKTFTFADTTNPRVVDYYKDGYMTTIEDPFQFRKIVNSTAGNGTSITCAVDEPFTAACIVSTVNVYPSPWGNVLTAWSGAGQSAFHAFVCVGLIPVTSGKYFWGLVRGLMWVFPTDAANWPLSSANELDVYFHIDGTLCNGIGATTASKQRAGHVMVSGEYGDCLIMLQIE
jgi:hypothetical protein